MEDMMGEVLTAVAVTVTAWILRRIESGRFKRVIRSLIVGVEKGSKTLDSEQEKTIKKQIEVASSEEGVKPLLHKLVKRVTGS